MGLTDLIRSFALSAALAVPSVSCTTNNYYGGDGSERNSCNDICTYLDSCSGLSASFTVQRCVQDCERYNLPATSPQWVSCIQDNCVDRVLDLCEDYLNLPECYDADGGCR